MCNGCKFRRTRLRDTEGFFYASITALAFAPYIFLDLYQSGTIKFWADYFKSKLHSSEQVDSVVDLEENYSFLEGLRKESGKRR